MTKLSKLPDNLQTYIVSELEYQSSVIDDTGNIEVRLNDDQLRSIARTINKKFCTTFSRNDILSFAEQYEKMINV